MSKLLAVGELEVLIIIIIIIIIIIRRKIMSKNNSLPCQWLTGKPNKKKAAGGET
jgi:hypothetical protein